MADDTTTLIFYAVLVGIFVIGVTMVVWWFIRSTLRRRQASAGEAMNNEVETPLSPTTRESLQQICKRMRSE